MKKLLITVCLFVLALVSLGGAQDFSTIRVGPIASRPACTDSRIMWFVTDAGSQRWTYCNGSVWADISPGLDSGVLPAGYIPPVVTVQTGSILMTLAAACPTGYSELVAANGRVMVGTLVANANTGTTGGSDAVTPAGTVAAPVFTGSALAGHAHELPWQIASTTTIRQIAAATFGSGTSRAATAVSAAGTANTTSAAVALSESKSAGTPAGTVSAPAFTGASFDNRSAFLRCLFCVKN